MFIYKEWEDFCQKLNENGFNSMTAGEILRAKKKDSFIILKHDIETNLAKALKLAKIENKYFHKGSFYVQAYLLKNSKNISILKGIQKLGHEVSYHHDVMDSNNGNIENAKEEFQMNKELFENNGFHIKTVCQHGNPVLKRKGYSSNRDFFRNTEIASLYKDISEIMVNFKSRINKDYKYISDSGYKWKIVIDPENNDIKSIDKDITIDLNNIIDMLKDNNSVIVSTHPHRWSRNIIKAKSKRIVYTFIKHLANCMWKIPLFKSIMNKFYYLAKKI